MIDFIGAYPGNQVQDAGRVGHIPVVQMDLRLPSNRLAFRLHQQMIDPGCVETGRPPFDPVDLIPFVEQKFGEVGAVLSGNAGDQRFFGSRP